VVEHGHPGQLTKYDAYPKLPRPGTGPAVDSPAQPRITFPATVR
jgi:hypothetical protein